MREKKIKALVKCVSSIKPMSTEHISCPWASAVKKIKEFKVEYIILTYNMRMQKHTIFKCMYYVCINRCA